MPGGRGSSRLGGTPARPTPGHATHLPANLTGTTRPAAVDGTGDAGRPRTHQRGEVAKAYLRTCRARRLGT